MIRIIASIRLYKDGRRTSFLVGIDLYLILLRRRKLLQNAYSHVRVCAQARAIENECFVVIAGSVGNLPRVHNMDIMILVSDVDLDLLNELHIYASVRNLKDCRNDLYEVRYKT